MESEEWRAFWSRPRSMVREEIERLRWCRSSHEFSRRMHCQAWLRAAIAPAAGSLRQHVSRDLLDPKRQIGASETHVWRRNAVVLDPTPLLFGDYSVWQNMFVMGIRAGQGWIIGMGEGNVW